MEALPLVFAGGWASGLNAYLVVLLTGLLGRYGGIDGVPATLQSTPVLVVAGVMFAVEFVVDKVPYLDSIWDGVSTVVRPAVGAWLGALLAGQAGDMSQVWAAVLGGGTALASHSLKSGFRLAVNTSPSRSPTWPPAPLRTAWWPSWSCWPPDTPGSRPVWPPPCSSRARWPRWCCGGGWSRP